MTSRRFRGKLGKEFGTLVAWPHYPPLRKKLVKTLRKVKGNALEIGCGPGNVTGLVLVANPSLKIVAIDSEPEMIKNAKKNLWFYSKKQKVKIIQQDALRFLKESQKENFDLVFSSQTIHNFNKNYRHKVLTQIFKVLKKGSMFINLDKYAVNSKTRHEKNKAWQFGKIEKEFKKINRQDLVKEWIKHYLEDENSEIIMKEEESKKELVDIGFKEVKILKRLYMDALLVAKK